jgi:endonuclease/exonuclease/phosphatase (EEP) superfamily protein YafD
VSVEWGSIDLVGVYIPPKRRKDDYEEYLDSLGDLIRQRSLRPILVAGDFNAKSQQEVMYGRVLGR